MKDLKIIDELLCMMAWDKPNRFADLEGPRGYNITNTAMKRLRQAYESGEMPVITLSLANYFDRTKEAKP